MTTRTAVPAAALLLAAALALPAPASAAPQDEGKKQDSAAEATKAAGTAKAQAPIAIEAVEVAPDAPGPETLCRLTVKLHNTGDRALTAFGFDVAVAGHPLPVYKNQLFLKEVGAGETVELPLYNFWTSETGRPAPADGKMAVEVTLREARWLKTGTEDGVEVWELQDAVEGLPVSARTVVQLKKK